MNSTAIEPKIILMNCSPQVRISTLSGINNLNINMNNEKQQLIGKREEFRSSVRKECLEGFFQQNRRKFQMESKNLPIIEIPNFSSTQELHKYLMDGEFKIYKLAAAGRKQELVKQLIACAINYDYYAILILGNILTQQNIEGCEEILFMQLKVAYQRVDIKMISNILNGFESLCSQDLTQKQLDYLLNNNLLGNMNQIVKQNLHEVYTDEEFKLMQSAAGVLCRFMHQFRVFSVEEQEKHLKRINQELRQSLYLMKQLLPLQLQYQSQQLMFLKNILQIILLEPILVEQLDNSLLQTCVKFLDISNNHLLILTTLRLMIQLSSLEDEKFVSRLFYLKGHEVVKQYINHESFSIRQAAIKVLANFASCSTETIQRELVSDHAFIAELITNFSNSCESTTDLLRLLWGIVENCMTYMPEDLIQDTRFFAIVRVKFLTDDSNELENIILYMRIIYTLLTYYQIYADGDSELESKLEQLSNHKNETISELAMTVIEIIKKTE